MAATISSKKDSSFWSRRKRLHLQNHILTYLILVPGALIFPLSPALDAFHQLEAQASDLHLSHRVDPRYLDVVQLWRGLQPGPLSAVHDQYRRDHRGRRHGHLDRQLAGRLRFRTISFSRQGHSLRPDAFDHDGADLGDAHPLIFDVQVVRLVEFLPADSGAGIFRAALLYLSSCGSSS